MHTSLAASNTPAALHFPMHGNVARNVTMSSREIAQLTGKEHKNVKRDIQGMLSELGRDALSFERIYLDSSSRRQTEYHLDRELTQTLITGYSIPLRHRVIQRLAELEAGERAQPTSNKVVGELAIAECYARLLKPAPSSQVAMLAKIAKINGLSTEFLPAYAIDAPTDADQRSSAPTKALTPLLREHGIDLSASAFNQLLKAHGVLKRMTRKNSRQQQVEFWSVTEAGLVYGKNMTSPNNPRETQPHWYVDRFAQLVKLVGGAA